MEKSFLNLRVVERDLTVLGLSKIGVISFPSLNTVGGTVKVQAQSGFSEIHSVDFPMLAAVGGDMVIGGVTKHYGTIRKVSIRRNRFFYPSLIVVCCPLTPSSVFFPGICIGWPSGALYVGDWAFCYHRGG